MSRWNLAAARLNDSLDGYWGEAVAIGTPAPQRLVASSAVTVRLADLIAIVAESGEQLGAVRGHEGFKLDVLAGEVVVSFSRTAFASKAAWPVKGEIIVADDRPVPATFEVVTKALDDGDRVNVRVVRRS